MAAEFRAILERVIGLIVDPARLYLEAALQRCLHRVRFDVESPVTSTGSAVRCATNAPYSSRCSRIEPGRGSSVFGRVSALTAAAENHDGLRTVWAFEIESGIVRDDVRQRVRDQRQREQCHRPEPYP